MNNHRDFPNLVNSKYQTAITSDNQLIFRKNSDLNFELQARNQDEENPYTPENFFSINPLQSYEPEPQLNYIASQISLQCLPTPKQDDNIKNQLNKTQINQYNTKVKPSQTYSTLMIYFNLKKFVEKISEKVRQTRKITDQQLQLIGDISSDSQYLLNCTKKSNSNQFKRSSIMNIMRLFQFQQQMSQMKIQKSLKNRIQSSIKAWFQSLEAFLQRNIKKIPLVEPDSAYKLIWDIITSIVRAYFIYWIPIEITYRPRFLFDDGVILTVILVLTLIVDVLIRLNTVYYVAGQAIRARWEILTLQLKNTLLEDTLSYVPLMMYTITGYTKLSQTIQFVHLLFFYQFKYISKVFDQVEDQLNLLNKKYQYILSITKLISLLLYILHLFSCFQFYLAEFANYEDNWIKYRDLHNAYWFTQYIDSFYYSTVTMLTIGYGDIVPQNNLEKLIAIFFMLLSCIWLSYCVNTVGTILQSISQNQNENKQKLFKINKYMEQRNISYQLQYKVKQYLNYRWQQDTAEDISEQKIIIDQLSNELKDELFEETVSIMINSCPIFLNNFSQQFKKQIIPYIQERIIEPDTIFKNQFNGINLLIIEQGQVEIYTGPTYKHINKEEEINKASILNKGQSMGVVEFLTDQVTKEQYRALGFLTLLSIDKNDFLQVLKDFPSDYEVYYQLRDSYLFQSHNPLQIKKQCYSCNSVSHDIINCPQIHLNVDREQVIKKYDFPQKQQREKQFTRRIQKSDFSFKRDCNILQQYGELFQEENLLLLKKQLEKQLEYDYSSESDNEDNKNMEQMQILHYQKIKSDFHQKIQKKQHKTEQMESKLFQINSNEHQSSESLQTRNYQISINGQSHPKLNIQSDDLNIYNKQAQDKDQILQKKCSLDQVAEEQQDHFIKRRSSNPNKNALSPEQYNIHHKNTKFQSDKSQQGEKLQRKIIDRQRSRQNTRIYHKNYEQEIQSFEVVYYKEQIKDFNQKQRDSIQKLYEKLALQEGAVPLDIFILYKKMKNINTWDYDFLFFEEQMKNFQKYKIEQNPYQVLYQLQEYQNQGKISQNKQYDQFRRFVHYMIYPWLYIQKYIRKNTEQLLSQGVKINRKRQNKSTIKIKLKKAIEIGKSLRLEKNKIYPQSQQSIKN